MATLNFPTSPALDQEYSFENRTWKWNGKGWELVIDKYALERGRNLSDVEDVSLSRVNLGLGSAAERDVGTGAGNVMEVGAFGLGAKSSPFFSASNMNEPKVTGFYGAGSSALTPFPDTVNILSMASFGNSYQAQIAVQLTQPRVFVRVSNMEGVFGSETELYSTLNLPQATAAELAAGTQTAPRIYTPKTFYDAAAFVTLTSSTSITPNLNSGNNFTLALTHNSTLANPTNAKSGQTGEIYIYNAGSTPRTLSFGTAWKFAGGTPELSTGTNMVDVISYKVVDANTIIAAMSKDYK